MKQIRYIYTLLLGSLIAFCMGCTTDNELLPEPSEVNPGDNFEVTFNLGQMNVPVATRAEGGDKNGSPLTNLYMVVLESEKKQISDKDICVAVIEPTFKNKEEDKDNGYLLATYSFKFKPEKKEDGTSKTYHLLAIANTIVDTSTSVLEIGKTKEEIAKGLSFSLDNIVNQTEVYKLPLWGELSNIQELYEEKVKKEDKVTPAIRLVPATAKMAVQLKNEIKYTLISASLYNYNESGYHAYQRHGTVAPEIHGLNVNISIKKGPEELMDNPSTTRAEENTDSTKSKEDTDFTKSNEVFLTESNPDEMDSPTFVILGLKKEGATKAEYFRIDFKNPGSESDLLPIVRNTYYEFKIISIGEGSGASSAEDAINNQGQKIEYELAVFDDFVSNMFYTPEGYFIGMGEIADSYLEGQDVYLPIQTNYPISTLVDLLKEKKIKITLAGKSSTILDGVFFDNHKIWGPSFVIPYKSIEANMDEGKNSLDIMVQFNDFNKNEYEFGKFTIQFAPELTSFKLTDARIVRGGDEGDAITQLFIDGEEALHTLRVYYEYEGDIPKDTEFKITTPRVGGVRFSGDFNTEKVNESGHYFELTAEGTAKMDSVNLATRKEEVKSFLIDASEIRKHFHIANEEKIVDKLYCNIPFVPTQDAFQLRVAVIMKTLADDTNLFFHIRERKDFGQLRNQEQLILTEEGNASNPTYLKNFHVILTLDTYLPKEVKEALIKYMKSDIYNPSLCVGKDKLEYTDSFGDTHKLVTKPVWMYTHPQTEKDDGKLKKFLTDFGKDPDDKDGGNLMVVGLYDKPEYLVNNGTFYRFDLDYAFNNVFKKEFHSIYKKEPVPTIHIYVQPDVFKSNFTRSYLKKERNLVGFQHSKYNFCWWSMPRMFQGISDEKETGIGSSKYAGEAFFSDYSFHHSNNKRIIDDMLAPLYALYKDKLKTKPYMHHGEIENLFGYPLVHFKIEYK